MGLYTLPLRTGRNVNWIHESSNPSMPAINMKNLQIGDHVKYLYTVKDHSEYRTGVLVDYDEEFHLKGHESGPRHVGIQTGAFLAQRSDITPFSLNTVWPNWIEEILPPVDNKERYPTINDPIK